VLVLGLAAWRIWPQASAALGVAPGSAEAPPVSVTTLDGDRIALRDLRGKVVLVNFWATWCAPCRMEMPSFQRVYDDLRDDGFVVLGIATDRGDGSAVRRFVSERDIRYPVARTTPEIDAAFGGIGTIPTSVLIDREGRIRHTVVGLFVGPALRVAANRLLAEGS
jgi:thiol-disulfide isomerase/thioredoxin